MSRIVNDDDEVITNQSDILNELATFYTNLYNQKTEREGGTRIAVDMFLEGTVSQVRRGGGRQM